MTKVLIVEFKKRKKVPEVYSTLPAFLDRYPTYKSSSLQHYLSRLKMPFEDDTLKVTQVQLLKREKQ